MLIHSFVKPSQRKGETFALRKIGEDKVVIPEYFKDCPGGKDYTLVSLQKAELGSLNMAPWGSFLVA